MTIVALCMASLCQAAEVIGIATLAEGEVWLVRQARKMLLKPGVRLQAFDLIETSPKSALTRLEFSSGLVADLGPATRVMLAPKLARRRQAVLYGLAGWLKLSASQSKDKTAAHVISESIEVADTTGSIVMSLQNKADVVFAESGTVAITERRQGDPLTATILKPGSFFVRTDAGQAATSPRPPTAFIQNIPKPFLDTLPLQAALFKSRTESAPLSLGSMSYAEARPWLDSEPAMKSFLVDQWKLNLGPNLRAGLAANIKSHPEWTHVLFPENFLPRTGVPPHKASF